MPLDDSTVAFLVIVRVNAPLNPDFLFHPDWPSADLQSERSTELISAAPCRVFRPLQCLSRLWSTISSVKMSNGSSAATGSRSSTGVEGPSFRNAPLPSRNALDSLLSSFFCRG